MRNFFKVSTILRNYFSGTVYRVCGTVSLRLYKAIILPFWLMTSPEW